MRRLSLTLIASCGIALLSACGSGGYAFNGTNSGGNIDSMAFTNGSGQVNDFIVAVNGNTPIEINAVGYKGSGQGALVVPDAQFTWQVNFSKPGTKYSTGASPSGASECGTPGEVADYPQTYTLLIQGAGAGPSPYYPAYGLINPFQATSTIFVSPTLNVDTLAPIGFATGSTTYCLQVDATHVGDGKKGSVTVVVTK